MGTTLPKREPFDGLGNHVYLEKQDNLRDIGVDIPTSQIVAVGSQSSGKSSLLESLTGFSFPRGQGLCTRYATQITLRRNSAKSIVISIIPWSDSDQDRKDLLREFHHELNEFDGKTLGGVIEKANVAMGIRSGASKDNMTLPMFSDDILKIEISGPDQPHLTVIDVPGLFQVTDEGITTELDKFKVENMVRRYMENERTIVLAVLSCLSDRATEGVLQLAKTADPEGVRTVGVLTKADLVTEQAVVQTIVQLVKGDTLKLGYYIVRNRGADEDSLSIAECQMKEREKLAESLWAELGTMGRTGVAALRAELQILLTELAKRELPKQRLEIEQRLSKCREKLDSMGPSRDTSASQRECLIRLASKFERIVRDALDGRYEGNSLFSKHVELKLATEIRVLNEGFSELMWQKGHSWKFVAESSREPTQIAANYEKRAISIIQSSIISSIQELRHLVGKTVHYRAPSSESIMGHIEKYYEESRGPELGTFGGSLLAMIFRAQASQWRNIVIIHVGVVSAVVHRFITTLLSETFGDQRMRDELYKSVLAQRLQTAYAQAKRQAKFLLDIELNGRPSTYNHYFTDNLQKARNARMTQGVRDSPRPGFEPAANKSNTEQVKEDIHDILKSYYKVSRKRFVDAICRQAIEYFLLDGSVSPLKVLSPELIATLTDSQLDMIAGEDVTTRRERECLGSEIQGLRAAMKVLQG